MTDQKTPDPWEGVKRDHVEINGVPVGHAYYLADVVDHALAAERAQHQQEVEDWIRIAARDAGDATARINAQASQIEELRTAISTAEATIEQRDETIRQLQDAFARCQEVQQATAETWRIEHDQMAEQIRLLRGAMAADDERLRRAAEQAGILYVGCDTAEALAEQIARLSTQVEQMARKADDTAAYEAWQIALAENATLRAERDAARQQIATLTQELSVSRANHIDANQRNMQSVRELEAAEARCAALTEAIEKALGFHQVTHTHAILSAALQSTRPQATETKPGIFVAAESTSVFKSTRTQEQP